MAKIVKKGKKKRKPRRTSEKWKKYAEGKTKQRVCPRCGPAIFLAKHKGRLFCGKCHYTEFSKE